VRRLAIRGLGGDEGDVYLANEEAEGRRQELSEFLLGRPLVPGSPSATNPPIHPVRLRAKCTVDCALPRRWVRRLKKAGGLKPCVLAGLAVLGEDD